MPAKRAKKPTGNSTATNGCRPRREYQPHVPGPARFHPWQTSTEDNLDIPHVKEVWTGITTASKIKTACGVHSPYASSNATGTFTSVHRRPSRRRQTSLESSRGIGEVCAYEPWRMRDEPNRGHRRTYVASGPDHPESAARVQQPYGAGRGRQSNGLRGDPTARCWKCWTQNRTTPSVTTT